MASRIPIARANLRLDRAIAFVENMDMDSTVRGWVGWRSVSQEVVASTDCGAHDQLDRCRIGFPMI